MGSSLELRCQLYPDYQNKITDSIFRDNDTDKNIPGRSLQDTITEEKFSINRTSTQAHTIIGKSQFIA